MIKHTVYILKRSCLLHLQRGNISFTAVSTLGVALLLAANSAGAQVFMCKNAQGATKYQDRPCAASDGYGRVIKLPVQELYSHRLVVRHQDKNREVKVSKGRISSGKAGKAGKAGRAGNISRARKKSAGNGTSNITGNSTGKRQQQQRENAQLKALYKHEQQQYREQKKLAREHKLARNKVERMQQKCDDVKQKIYMLKKRLAANYTEYQKNKLGENLEHYVYLQQQYCN